MLDDDDLGELLRQELHGLHADVAPSRRLLRGLEEIPNHRTRKDRRRWMFAPVLALAVAAVAIIVLAGEASSPSPALAFVINDGRMTRVSLHEIVSVAPANAKLRALGRVRAVVMTASCATSTLGYDYEELKDHPTPRIELGGPPTTPSTLIVAASAVGRGRIIVAIGVVRGPAPACLSTHGTGPGIPGWTPQRSARGSEDRT